ncbi:MAG TPA: hypothetical protein VHL79_01075 [Ramlibacter sp.]|jgi:hypothetical protein|nr:hypothetical protein [Ramlibacter sp.]
MDPIKPAAGGALALNRARNACFEDSSWDDRLEKLVKHTQRTSLIMELTGTDASQARIKSYVRQHLQACGIDPNLPRGNPPSYESKAFLRCDDDRLDAAYLVALHYGPRGPGEFSEVEPDLAQALDKRLEVYGRYCADLYPPKGRRERAPRLKFEDYLVLVQGIQAKVIAMHTCRECKGSHPYSTVQTVTPTCPFCNRMKLDMGDARAQLQQRIQQQRAAQRALSQRQRA